MVKGRKFAVFTMDLEDLTDTGCIRESDLQIEEDMLDGLDEYIKLLDKYGIKATLFAVNDAALKVKERLKSYIKNGHDLALHGFDHAAPITVGKNEFKEKITLAKKQLEETFGVKITGYRAPFFSLDNSRLEILRELGFTYDSSKFDFPKRSYAAEIDTTGFSQIGENIYCRSGFYEFGMPLNKFLGLRVPVSGGGYVRIGDWGFFSTMLHHYLINNNYYVFYLHPFELSKAKMPETPNLKGHDKYYLRAGLKSYPRKVEAIIRMLKKLDYEFITFSELASRLEADEKLFE